MPRKWTTYPATIAAKPSWYRQARLGQQKEGTTLPRNSMSKSGRKSQDERRARPSFKTCSTPPSHCLRSRDGETRMVLRSGNCRANSCQEQTSNTSQNRIRGAEGRAKKHSPRQNRIRTLAASRASRSADETRPAFSWSSGLATLLKTTVGDCRPSTGIRNKGQRLIGNHLRPDRYRLTQVANRCGFVFSFASGWMI